MKYLNIEHVNKPVSTIVFGTATPIMFAAVSQAFEASSPELEERKQKAFNLLDDMYNLGITTFDCAAHYGEEVIGEWMSSRGNRENIVIITKCAHPNQWRNRVTDYDILYDIHNSLAKLKTDYIDIYMLHRDDMTVPVDDIVKVLNKLHMQGKIRAFGGSNWTYERIALANAYSQENNLLPFTVSSPNFGIAEQVDDPWGGGCVSISGPTNKVARQWYCDNHITVFAYSSLARGFFSGVFKSNEPEKAKEFLDAPGMKGYYSEENFKRLERVEILAKKKNASVAQIAMAWILSQPMSVAALTSPVSMEQMCENIRSSEIVLNSDELAWLDLEKNHFI